MSSTRQSRWIFIEQSGEAIQRRAIENVKRSQLKRRMDHRGVDHGDVTVTCSRRGSPWRVRLWKLTLNSEWKRARTLSVFDWETRTRKPAMPLTFVRPSRRLDACRSNRGRLPVSVTSVTVLHRHRHHHQVLLLLLLSCCRLRHRWRVIRGGSQLIMNNRRRVFNTHWLTDWLESGARDVVSAAAAPLVIVVMKLRYEQQH